MTRRTTPPAIVALLACLLALGAPPAADAATKTALVLSPSAAYAVLKIDCNGIGQQVYATGFALNGYPAGAEHLETTCVGRYGHRYTYTAWASSVWTWYGQTRSYTKLEKEPEGLSTTFTAEDPYGDKQFNEGSSAFLETTTPPVKAPAAPTNVFATPHRSGEEEESGPQYFDIGWRPDPENQELITSSYVTATPVNSTAPVLSTTVTGTGSGVQLGTLEPLTTYRIVVTSTDEEGTSQQSEPIEVKSLSTVQTVPPIAITEAAAGVGKTTATLEGYVNPAGEPVSLCQFEYGTTEAYGTVVACSVTSEGETPVPVSAPLTGLTPNTTYHYRLVAEGPGGTSYGHDQPFTTTPTVEPPKVTKLVPKTGPAAGGTTVTITGTGFTEASEVRFGTVVAETFKVNSATSITATSPESTSGVVDVTVTTPAGTSAPVLADHFTFAAPTVTGLSPASGPKAGGTTVTITGSGFALGSATKIKFGGLVASGVECTTTRSCTAVSPKVAKAEKVEVVATANGKSSKKTPPADTYTYE